MTRALSRSIQSISDGHDQLTLHLHMASWKNMKASSQIQWPRLKGINFHSNVTCEPLIENEETYRMATPNFAYLHAPLMM